MDEYPHTVTFQESIETDDGGGGKIQSWVDLFTTEAHVQPVKSSEYVSAQQLTNPINHEVYYPYQKGVKGHMRALYDEQTLELRSNPLDQGGMGEIMMVKAELK
jgi:SPP1 family predicted phage head-tail adaptor